jgi:acyl-CoA thioesterase I
VLLVACQRTPAPKQAETEAQAPAAAAPDHGPAIVAFGDSLTAGFGLDPGKSYPDFLQKDLDRLGYAYRVVNAGISGDTTTDGLARVAMVLADHPAIVILEFGGNDGLRGLPVATTQANLGQMIVALQKGGTRVVLAGMTLPPNYGPDYISKFRQIYPDLAGRYKLPLIPFLLEGVATDRTLMQRDGLHPNAQGCRRVAETVLRAIEPLLSRVAR